MNSPCESYIEMPSASISRRAFADGLLSCWSIDLNDVPASEPISPADANAVRPPTVSSIERPVCEATRPACDSAMPRSATPPCALPAPAARRSAMCDTSSPARPNCVIALDAISAACATSMLSDAAKSSAPERPPLRMSAVDTPAFASSSIAAAASVALYFVDAPASIAACRNCSISAAGAIVAACTDDIASSKSAADLTAMPAKPVSTAPAPRKPLESVLIEVSCLPTQSRARPPASFARFVKSTVA